VRSQLEVLLLVLGDRRFDLFPIGGDVGGLGALGQVLNQTLAVSLPHGSAVRVEIFGHLGLIGRYRQSAEAEILDPIVAEFFAVAVGAPAIVAEMVAVGRIKEL